MRALIPACTLLLLLSWATPSTASIFDDIINQIAGLFRHYEEAPYSIVRRGNGYEERLYPATKWVCTPESTNPAVGQDLSLLFWPLFNYITGQNERGENIPMTVPVSTEFTVRSATDKVYEMCFYLGQEHQDNPPSPLPNAEVHIQERPEMHVLTRTVGGYKTHEEDWMEEAGLLAAVLEEDGISVDLSHMYWTGYDAPMKFWNRRNEIWYKIN